MDNGQLPRQATPPSPTPAIQFGGTLLNSSLDPRCVRDVTAACRRLPASASA